MTTNGKEQELGNRRDIVTDSLAKFDENCHPDREEHLFFGEQNEDELACNRPSLLHEKC